MPRTLISLDAAEKAWLDREARKQRVPMTELVRQAVRDLRLRQESRTRPTLTEALAATAGLWRKGDGLAWQRRLRAEWNTPADDRAR